MLEEREIQKKTGRIIPQTNEEYGYEDHYPHWAPGHRRIRRRRCAATAWDIAMAGAYGTAGESARRGTNIWPDTGGGWINGRGDDTMIMLKGYAHMVDFFTSFEWWKTEPHDELVNNGAYCLAEPGPDLRGVSAQRRQGHGEARTRDVTRPSGSARSRAKSCPSARPQARRGLRRTRPTRTTGRYCFGGSPSDHTDSSLPLGSVKWNRRPPGNEKIGFTIDARPQPSPSPPSPPGQPRRAPPAAHRASSAPRARSPPAIRPSSKLV